MRASLDRGLTDWTLRLVAVAYAGFSFLDWLTTASALSHGGHEGNPIAASLYRQYGLAGMLLFKAAAVGVIIATVILIPRRIMSRRIAVWVVTAFAALTAFTVIGNLHAIASLAAQATGAHRL